MAKRGVDDAMFCEACGAHRDQLGLAGDDIRACPNCGRATCTNCWNQIAGACLTCRAFALPIAAAAPKPAVAAAAATSPKPPRTSTPRRFKRATRPQADPVVTQMPGVVEAAAVPSTAARVARFGHIRIGRVIRATAIGSTLAISIAAVGFAGVFRLGPTTAPVGPEVANPETAAPWFATAEPAATATQVPRPSSVAPVEAAVVTGPDERRDGVKATYPPSGDDPAGGPPSATKGPAATATPTAGATATPTAGATATATPDPTATPQPTATPDPTATPEPAATPEPTMAPTPEPPTPTPTTPLPDPTTEPSP